MVVTLGAADGRGVEERPLGPGRSALHLVAVTTVTSHVTAVDASA